MKTFFPAALALCLCYLASACDKSPPKSSSANPGATHLANPAPNVHDVLIHITDNAYSPPVIEVAAGDTVTWVNDGDNIHTATSNDNGTTFNTKDIFSGNTKSIVFNTPGTIPYHCTHHSTMTGKITVKAP